MTELILGIFTLIGATVILLFILEFLIFFGYVVLASVGIFIKSIIEALTPADKDRELEWWEKDEDPEEYKPKFKGEPE